MPPHPGVDGRGARPRARSPTARRRKLFSTRRGSTDEHPEHFDAVVVGSGFGGSVTAHRLAEGGKSVCVLERGKRVGARARSRAARARSRATSGTRATGLYGFFDIWTFKGIEALVSSCLGGGSIIYANVLLRKDEEWFVHEDGEDWPVTPRRPRAALRQRRGDDAAAALPVRASSRTRARRRRVRCATRPPRSGVDWRLPPLAVTFANPGQPPVAERADRGRREPPRRRGASPASSSASATSAATSARRTRSTSTTSRASSAAGGEIRTLAEVKSAPRRATAAASASTTCSTTRRANIAGARDDHVRPARALGGLARLDVPPAPQPRRVPGDRRRARHALVRQRRPARVPCQVEAAVSTRASAP